MDELIARLGGTREVGHLLAVGLLVAARLAPLTFMAPWLSMRGAPALVRTGVLLALTMALTPLALGTAADVPLAGGLLVALALRESLIGMVFALTTSIPFFALDYGGRLVDTWRGANLAEVIAPPTGERTSPLGDLYLLFGVALFVTLGGHRIALGAFADSLRTVPVGVFHAHAGIQSLGMDVAHLVSHALTFAVMLAAPAAATIILVEISLGLLSRAAPQVPAFFAGMPLRAAAGLAGCLLSASWLVGALSGEFRGAIVHASRSLLPFAGP